MSIRSVFSWLLALAAASGGSAAFAGDGAVALQSAEPSCTDSSSRIFVACGNGTVTDKRTGLVWLARADCFDDVTWERAMDLAAGLADIPEEHCLPAHTPMQCDCELSDGSSPGDWRLPSIAEFRTLLQPAVDKGCTEPAMTGDWGVHCWEPLWCFVAEPPRCAFEGFSQVDHYWSASPYDPPTTIQAWHLAIHDGDTFPALFESTYRVWPVRGGQ